jgi:hypothetical protein
MRLLASSLSRYTAAVGTAWPLLGSHRNGQATLYLFRKKYILLCSRPTRIYGAPILLFSGKRGHFVSKAAGVRLPTHFHILPRLKMTIRIHGWYIRIFTLYLNMMAVEP